jgi:GNAT superfamily N-acetyltransferase
MKIKRVETEADFEKLFHVMKELRPQYELEAFVQFVQKELTPVGVSFAVMEDAGEAVCASGFRVSASLAWGRFIYVDDIVTREAHRSKGYGKEMLDWIVAYGRERGCSELHLDSGVQRHEAHRFYLRERMDIVFYHFRKHL